MKNNRMATKVMRHVAAGTVLLTVMVSIETPLGRAGSQADASVQQAQAMVPQSFEVASIKPSAPQQAGIMRVTMGTSAGGRYTASGVTVKMLIQQAYDLKDYQISGGPSWISSERYDINAKAENPDVSREQMRVLLQSLLAERFNLKIHRESKELPIYALVVGKDGPKLKKSEVQPGAGTDVKPPDSAKSGDVKGAPVKKAGNAGAPPVIVSGGGVSGGVPVWNGSGASGGGGARVAVMRSESSDKGGSMMRMSPGQLSAQAAPISTLVTLLAQTLGRPVMDKTGLEGAFDFTLEYTPDESQRGMGIGGVDRPDMLPPSDFSGPSIFTAIQDQLGLKLESEKGPVEILVIDRVDKPTPD
jgi:uncharacterized protein (TIGR03435 family)